MKTVIVPVDFSSISARTAKYAMKMLTGVYHVNVVLFHVFSKPSEEEKAYFQLEKLKTDIMEHGIAKVACYATQGDDFPTALATFARHRGASLIVMGMTGKTALQKIFLTSNTLKIIEMNPCPVLVIPPSAEFISIKNVALACDFKDVVATIPSYPIKTVLELFRPQLHIVNVNAHHYVSLTDHYLEQRKKIAEMFEEYKPSFYFIGTFDFHEAINQFVDDRKIDMVVTIPRRHSVMDTVFRMKNTKKLVLESTVPVLAAGE